MKTKTKKIFFFSCFSFFVVFIIFLLHIPFPAQANSTLPDITFPDLEIKIPGIVFSSAEDVVAKCDKNAEGKATVCYFPWIGEYIIGIYKYAVGITGILSAVVLIWGGVIWLTAGGSQQRVTEAQSWIKGSVLGLTLILSSYILLFQINPALLNFKLLTVNMVQEYVPSDELLAYDGFTSGGGSGGSSLSYDGHEWDALILAAAQKTGVDPALIKAIMATESHGNNNAKSRKGALGLMQLMPETAKDLGVTDRLDPNQNLTGGARYIKSFLKSYGSLDKALAAYNWGPGNFEKKGGMGALPTETRNYIVRVTGYYKKFKGTFTL